MMHILRLLTLLAASGCLFLGWTAPRARCAALGTDAPASAPDTAYLAAQAERFLDYMRTDPDEQATYGAMLVDTFLAANQRDAAAALAERFGGYLQLTAWLTVGKYDAVNGNRAAAEQALARVEEPRKVFREMRRRRIEARRAALLALVGRPETEWREAFAGAGVDPDRFEQEATLFEYLGPAFVEKNLADFVEQKGLPASVCSNAALAAARGARKAGDPAGEAAHLDKAANALKQRLDVMAMAPATELAQSYLRLGKENEASEWATILLAIAGRASPILPERYIALGDGARVLTAIKPSGAIEQAVQDALAGLDVVDPIKRAQAGFGMWEAMSAIGKREEGRTILSNQLAAAYKHPHHRARAMAGIDAIRWAVRTGAGDPLLKEQLDALAKSIESDPHFRGNAAATPPAGPAAM